jgi:hypothetical protein
MQRTKGKIRARIYNRKLIFHVRIHLKRLFLLEMVQLKKVRASKIQSGFFFVCMGFIQSADENVFFELDTTNLQ